MYKMHIKHDASNFFLPMPVFEKNLQYDTRNEEKNIHVVPKYRLDIYKRQFIPNVIHKWNELLNVVIKSSSFCQFRRGIYLKFPKSARLLVLKFDKTSIV